MKVNRLVVTLLLLLTAAVFQVTAQQSEADRKRFEKIKTAAEKGDVDAQFNLGAHYANGIGVSTNLSEAVKWLTMAAEHGNPTAQRYVGDCYLLGKGVSKDFATSAKWYRRAAEQGELDAQWNLAVLYFNGRGLAQDYVEAYKWINLAAVSGESNAILNRATFAREMTPDQIAHAQRLTREFRPREELDSRKSRSPDNTVASGTGFFISEDGYLISNAHVVEGAAQIRLVTSAGIISAKVVKMDAANDLALLKADIIPAPPPGFVLDKGEPTKFTPLPVAASRTVKLGGTVATVGFPNIGLQGFSPKLAKGEIASLSGAADDARYFQISVPVQPGNSGGALVDERGNVVGVVSAKLSARAALASSGALPENVNYAIKSSYLLSFLESVPEVSAKLKEPNTKEMKFEDVVKAAEQAAVLVLVY